jgi:hypothetical protein
VHDAADDAAIIHPLFAPDIRWQMGFDPIPLLIAQPEQIPAHQPCLHCERINIALSAKKN